MNPAERRLTAQEVRACALGLRRLAREAIAEAAESDVRRLLHGLARQHLDPNSAAPHSEIAQRLDDRSAFDLWMCRERLIGLARSKPR